MIVGLQLVGPWLPATLPGWWPDPATLTTMHWLGLLALLVLWTNMLLIAGAAALELQRLWARGRVISRHLIRARVVEGDGPDGALARHRVRQVGRTRGDDRVHFHDRGVDGEVFGGVVELVGDGRRARLAGVGEAGEVWPARAALERAAACPDADAFAAAEGPARTARGWTRELTTTMGAGDVVWICGALVDEGASVTISAPPDGALLVSAVDPVRGTALRGLLAGGFAVVSVALTLACSVLALWPPVFGAVSTLGAFAGIVLWLGFMPVGTAVRDAVLPPSRAFVRGVWRRRHTSP